jgi:hypothetical protein
MQLLFGLVPPAQVKRSRSTTKIWLGTTRQWGTRSRSRRDGTSLHSRHVRRSNKSPKAAKSLGKSRLLSSEVQDRPLRSAPYGRWLTSRNPAGEFKPSDVLPQRTSQNHARVEESELPELLRKIEAYQGTPSTRFAIKLLALTFVLTSELIEATSFGRCK